MFPVVVRLLDLRPARCCNRDMTPVDRTRTQGETLGRKTLHPAGESGPRGRLDEFPQHVLADGPAYAACDLASCVISYPELARDCCEGAAGAQPVQGDGKALLGGDGAVNAHDALARDEGVQARVQLFEPAGTPGAQRQLVQSAA